MKIREMSPVRVPPKRADDVIVRRRRAVLVEVGIEQRELAKILSRVRRRPLSRAGVTNLIGGYYSSRDRQLERAFVEEVQTRLREQAAETGRADLANRAEEITMQYLEFPEE